MTEQVRTFPGSQEDLYAIAFIGWQNCSNYISRFQTFNAQYTPEHIENTVAAIAAAKALPNADARQAQLTYQRVALEAAAAVSTGLWQDLYVYINRSFDKTRLASMRKLAGGEYYTAAANNNWKALDTMLIMASEFLGNHTNDLKNGNMPVTFEATFNDAKAAFETAVKNYSDIKTNIQKDTEAKTAANNAVYAALTMMLQDAKAIFRKDVKNRKYFTYTALAKLVGKKGKSGFRITVKEAGTLMPVTTSTFLFQPGNITAFVNAKGVAEVYLLKGIVYSATVTTPGYNTTELTDLQADTGVMHRLEVIINKAVAAA